MAEVVDTFGVVGTIPDEQLEQALAEGYRIASPEQVAQAQLQTEYGGVGHQIGAAVTGAARGATLGLSDMAIAGLGGDEALKAYDALHPELRIGGEVAGSLAGLGKFGGGGLLARGARTITSPARTAMRVGLAAEEAAAARGLGRATQIGIGAATEGALQGLGGGLADAAIDHELNGEKLAASVLGGALFGGVIGGGLGKVGTTLGRVLQRPGAEGVERAAMAAGGEIGPWGQKIGRVLGDTSAFLTGNDPSIIRRFAEDKGLRRLAVDADNLIESYIPAAQKRLDALYEADATVSENVMFGSLKRQHVAGNIPEGKLGEQQAAFATQLQGIRNTLEEMQAGGKFDFNPHRVAQTKHLVDKIEKQIASAIESGSKDVAADIHHALDVQLKREIGRAVKGLKGKTIDAPTSAALEKWQELYSGLRNNLEDTDIWGRAAEFQRELNAPIHRSMGTNEAFLGDFYQARRDIHPTDPWKSRHLADPEKIRSHTGRLANSGDNLAARAMRDTLEQRNKAYEALLKYGDLDASSRQAAENALKLTKEQLEHLGDIEKAVRAKSMLGSLESDGTSLAGLAGAALGSGNLGFMVAAPLLNPARTIRQIAAVEKLADTIDTRMAGKVSKLFKGAMPTAAGMARTPARVGATVARGAKRHTDRRQEFIDKAAKVRALSGKSEGLKAELEQQLSMLSNGAPTAQATAVQTALRATDYLQKHLPGSALPSTPFSQPRTPSRLESEAWLRRLKAIEDPTALLDDLEDGRLSREAVDAVKNVYPGLFQELQQKVMDHVVELDAAGKRPPYEKRKQLGILLGVPTDGTMTPEMIATFQNMYAQESPEQRQGRPAPRKAPDIAAAFQSGSEETVAGSV